MYVDTEDGLKVREHPSLKSNRLCGLAHRFPVKVVAIGKEETIDGITAPWVEILIPSHEWKGYEPEYGWVFGGYLIEKQPEFQIPKNKDQLTMYLESSFWNLYWEYGGTGDVRFGYFENGKIYAVEQDWQKSNYSLSEIKYLVTFRAISGHEYYSDECSFWMSPSVYVKEKVQQFLFKKGTFEITNIDDRWFTNRYGSACEDDFAWEFMPERIFLGKLGSGVNFDSTEMLYNKRMYATIDGKNAIQWLAEKNALTDDFAKKCIEMGLSADNTPYYNYYRNFWDPIMMKHQKKADEIKSHNKVFKTDKNASYTDARTGAQGRK